MQVCKLELDDGTVRVGAVCDDDVVLLPADRLGAAAPLSRLLHAPDPGQLLTELMKASDQRLPADRARLVAPIDGQEVWAAGVTYRRSQVARRQESQQAGSFYDLVYRAERPELFFKATPGRVVGPGQKVRLRRDSRWCVPEPELALVISPRLDIIGYTVGDDVSCRDIEGENPLYLPQAKVFDGCCALGPVITLAPAMPPLDQVVIRMQVRRREQTVYEGETSLSRMARSPQELVSWLARDQKFPHGVFLLTGTGIVPPDDFTLRPGDLVSISIDGIGTLSTGVTRSGEP